MEAICKKLNHENNRVQFICQFPDCPSLVRLGCSHCQLLEHNNHQDYNIELQTFCGNFHEQYRQFQLELKSIVIPEKRNITREFAIFRQAVNQKIDQYEQQVKALIENMTSVEPIHMELVKQVEYLQKKKIFDMNPKEIDESIEFVHGKHLQQLKSMIQSLNKEYYDKYRRVDEVFDSYFSQMEHDVRMAFDDNQEIQEKNENKKEFAQRKLEQFQAKQQRIKKETAYFQEIVEQAVKEEKKIEMEIKVQKQKAEQEKKQQEKLIQEQTQELKKSMIQQQKVDHRQEILKTFPHKVYTKDCAHRFHCNTIPIFNCCNRAFPCGVCHGFHLHPPLITQPSYRYCMKCLDIYLVPYPTNQAVNCMKCQY